MVEQLNRDAGYDPVRVGDLKKAAAQESASELFAAIYEAGLREYVCRIAPLERL